MRLTLRSKLALVALTLVVITLGPLSWAGMRFFRHDKERSLQDLNAQTVVAQARDVARRLRFQQRALGMMGAGGLSPGVRPLVESTFQNHAWAGVFSFREGKLSPEKIVAAGEKLPGEAPEAVAADASLAARLKELKSGESRLFHRRAAGGAPAVLFAARLGQDLFGLAMGPTESIYDTRTDTKVYSVLLLDRQGNLVLHSDVAEFPPTPVYAAHPAVRALQNPQLPLVGGTASYHDALTEKEVIGAYATLGIAEAALIAQIPAQSAFAAAEQLIKKFAFLAFVIFGIALGIGILFADSLSRPVRRLAQAAGRVGKGEFRLDLKANSKDEIGELTTAFVRMGSELDERDKRLEEARNQLVQSEKMSAFGQMSAGIAHEVKNPLAGILGYAQLAKKKAAAESGLDKYLEIIEKETKRCKDIVENLMRFARQEKAEAADFDVNQATKESVALVDHQITISGHKIERRFAPDGSLPLVRGNANQIQQVLTNLMLNAYQAMKEKGTITVSTRLGTDNSVEILVADTGEGIPKENLRKIFEPFFTTKPAGKGTGLGLAVTYGIIKDHNGNIEVQSELGKGTTFTVRLPGREAAATAA